MNQRTIEIAERALMDFLKRNRRERDYYRGRLIKADNLPAPKQHMISAAASKMDWYKIQINEIEGELEMLREEFGIAAEEEAEPAEGEEAPGSLLCPSLRGGASGRQPGQVRDPVRRRAGPTGGLPRR